MRFMILYMAAAGLAAHIVTAPQGSTELPEFDPTERDEFYETHGLADEDGDVLAIVGLPDGDFRPDLISGENGEEVPVTFFDMHAANAVSMAGPDSGVTGDDTVDNTAANNG